MISGQATAALVASLVLSACAADTASTDSMTMNAGGTAVVITEPPKIYFGFTPDDGTTGHGDEPVLLNYDANLYGSGDVDPDLLAQLAAVTFFQTWPERENVPFSFQPQDVPRPHWSAIIPATPLENRWYVLGVGPGLPENAITYFPILPDGLYGVRFRPDSHPRFTRFEFCPQGTPMNPVISVEILGMYSEPTSGNITLTANGSPVSCAPLADETRLRLRCDGFSMTAPLNIVASGGVESGNWSFTLPQGTPCSEFRTPI
jgi:hypothetical protein